MDKFRTVHEYGEAVDIINKSRFIGYIQPIDSVEEANTFIEGIKKKHWDASHNVPVYVLGDKFQIQKYSDDGEPSGTAGVPILNMLKNEGITNVVIVITRYFGGIKLGTGGLVRAYTQSAKSAMKAGKIIDQKPYVLYSAVMDYTLHGKIQNFLSNNTNYLLKDTLFTDRVVAEIYVELEDVDAFEKSIIQLSSNQVELKSGDEVVLSISDGCWIRE